MKALAGHYLGGITVDIENNGEHITDHFPNGKHFIEEKEKLADEMISVAYDLCGPERFIDILAPYLDIDDLDRLKKIINY